MVYIFQFFHVDNIVIYGLVYLLQLISSVYSMILSGVYDFGFFFIIYELEDQYKQLLHGINEAFVYRKENEFPNRIVDCIRQHQLIIK